MVPRILTVTALLTLLGLSSCRSGDGGEMDKMVDIGTHSLHIRCVGKGSPVVVIDTGVGDTSERWQSFQAQVAQVTRVCTYDRAGYGSSSPGPMPRSSSQAASELKALLGHAGIREPYLLVQSIEMFREMGMTETALGVDTQNPSGALHLYESVGYREGRRHTFFNKRMNQFG